MHVRRKRKVTIAALTVILLAIGGATAVLASGHGARHALRDSGAAPLPAGEPNLHAFDASIQNVGPADIAGRATTVFVGTVTDKGGSEVAAPASDLTGPAVTVHRIRFDVAKVLRGPKVTPIDVTAIDAADLDPFEIGKTYVVFAEPRTFGTETSPRLAVVGYWQGAFATGNARSGRAANRRGDSVDIDNPLAGVAPAQH